MATPSELPTLAWVGEERKATYGAYALRLRIEDDSHVERTLDIIAYGVDKEGPAILLGNHTLQECGATLDLSTQTWKLGLASAGDIELVEYD